MLSYIEIPEGCLYRGFIITVDTFGVEVCKLFWLFILPLYILLYFTSGTLGRRCECDNFAKEYPVLDIVNLVSSAELDMLDNFRVMSGFQ